ncbi:hypothetical protein QE432_004547 [Agrobacterium sp. SORGH_AS 745]|nr:hypothetical protein [Agrobacterium sp. SORGH_AS_0745]
MNEIVEFVPEQIERTGDGQRYQKGQYKKASVEVPAPYGAGTG